MKYALGNMLNGAGGLNADQLALDLQFATDKTLTARKGPTPVFTRASSGTFVGSNGLIQSAGNNVARFDHDPVTLASRGLLIEEQRQNLAIQSEGFSTGSWIKQGSTVTADSIASPDGAVTADLLVEDSGLSTHVVQQAVPSLTAGQAYTISVFAKAGSHTSFQLVPSVTAFGSGLFANFVLTSSGSVGTSSGVTASIQSYPNGWYRCSITIASVSGGSGGFFVIAANNNNSSATRTPSYQGTGAQVVHLWGAQLEAGSFPTSYIPTTTASVVRSADVCSITGAAFSGLYNQPEGTLFADVTPQAVDQSSAVIVVNTTFFNNQHGIYKTNAALSGAGRRWGSTTVFTAAQTSITTSTDVAISGSRLAYGYKLNDFAFAYAGGIVGTDTSGTIPSPTAMRIGSRDDGLAINGHLAAVRYFRKRLDNAKLQALTV